MADERKTVVVAGGGIGALEAVLALRDLVGDAVDIELIAPAESFVFAPMTVAAPFDRGGAAQYPLADFAREQGATLRSDTLESVEPETKTLTTSGGARVSYDALLVAIGARPVDAVAGAATFPGPAADESLRDAVDDLTSGDATSLAFVVPGGVTWPLPAYELALLTASELERRGAAEAKLHLVTAEDSALGVFGAEASAKVGDLLAARGIVVHAGAVATAFQAGQLELDGGAAVPVDRVVALRGLAGRVVPGLPADPDGFIPTDAHCGVEGAPSVYAVGDATTFPLKQGGLAAQQADAAVEAIAAELGLHENPAPFTPVLRGQLLTGGRPFYLRAELAGGETVESAAERSPLWWPPTKVAGKLLAPYLAAKRHSDTEVSGKGLVDRPADAAEAPDADDAAALAAALATVDVSWVTPTSLRPRRDA